MSTSIPPTGWYWLLKQAVTTPPPAAAAAAPPTTPTPPAANWMDHLRGMWDSYGRNAGIGAGAGALLAGGASAMSHGSDGETPGERRRRILRDALVGGTFGAGAGVALPAAADAFATASPPETPTDKKVNELTEQFRPNKTLGGFSGAALLGGGTYARNFWNRGKATLADFHNNLSLKANSWKDQWEQANMQHNAFLDSERSRLWNEGMKMVPKKQILMGRDLKGKPITRPQTPDEHRIDIEKYRTDQFNRTHGADLEKVEMQHQLGNLKAVRSNWANLKLPDAAGNPKAVQQMFKEMQAAHPGVAPAALEEAFHRQLLQKLKQHIATDGSGIVRQMSATGRMGGPTAYTGTLKRAPRPGMGAGGWAKVLGMGAAPLLVAPAADSLNYLYNTWKASKQ